MTLHLPTPKGESESLREEIHSLLGAIRNYRNPMFPEDVEKLIHEVAMNREVSAMVVAKICSELPACRREYFRISVNLLKWWLALILLSFIIQTILNDHSHAVELLLLCAFSGTTLQFFFIRYLDWREEYRDSYIANFLIRTLEFGLRYESALTDEQLRDGLATMIQRTAVRYTISYKRSHSTRFFSAQVRRQARNCRRDIISLIPSLVTAGQAEIKVINENLARLIIRTQMGYWYQTADIARHGTAAQRRDAIRVSVATFIKDRTIQAAFIALWATILAALIGISIYYFK